VYDQCDVSGSRPAILLDFAIAAWLRAMIQPWSAWNSKRVQALYAGISLNLTCQAQSMMQTE
jgi:hypothetical protein